MSELQPVVFCTYDSPDTIGGPFTWLGKLLPALRANGIDSRVLALTHYGGTGPLIEQLREKHFSVTNIDCQDRTESQIKWILAQLHDSPPKVFVPNFVISAMFAASWLRNAGCSTIGILHSDDPFYRAIQDEFIFGSRKFQLTDIVSVSEAIHKQVCDRKVSTAIGRHYIPYGVDVPTRNWNIARKTFRLAYVGRLAEEQKRISLVTESLIAACNDLPDTEAVIFGDGPDKSRVENLLSANKARNVTLAGRLTSEQIMERLVDFDAIVLLSDYEGLPIALLEGMSAGCVAITKSIASGIPQLITDKETGILISEDKKEFIDAVNWLRTNKERRECIAKSGRDLVANNYSHTHSVAKWTELLRARIQHSKPAPFTVPRHLRLPQYRFELESEEARRKPASRLSIALKKFRRKLGAIRRKILRFDHE